MAIIGTKISSVSTSGEIVGISASEVAEVFGAPLITDSATGVTGDAVGYLTGYHWKNSDGTEGGIKKYNVHKPVTRSKYGKLSEADFKGDADQIANGIIYGLKVGIDVKSINQMHSATWDYVVPTNGIYRLGDFDGYDHSIVAPNLSGAGLYDGQRVDYYNEVNVQLVWGSKEGAIDLAEVFVAKTNQTPNYGDMYLCVLVGTWATACVNKTIGGKYPIIYNNIQCNSFAIPAWGDPGTNLVTLFFADGAAIDANIGGRTLRNNWVDMAQAPNFGSLLISVPNQVGKTINFVRDVVVYIDAFSLSVDTSQKQEKIYININKGESWNSAYAYRIKWSATYLNGDIIGTNYTTSIDKNIGSGNDVVSFEGPAVGEILQFSVMPGSRYNITGTMQYQTVSGGAWNNTTFSSTVNIAY